MRWLCQRYTSGVVFSLICITQETHGGNELSIGRFFSKYQGIVPNISKTPSKRIRRGFSYLRIRMNDGSGWHLKVTEHVCSRVTLLLIVLWPAVVSVVSLLGRNALHTVTVFHYWPLFSATTGCNIAAFPRTAIWQTSTNPYRSYSLLLTQECRTFSKVTMPASHSLPSHFCWFLSYPKSSNTVKTSKYVQFLFAKFCS